MGMNRTDLVSYLSNVAIFGTDIVMIKLADGSEHDITNVIIERAPVSLFPAEETPPQKIILEF